MLLRHLVQVLVVSPGEMDRVEAAAFLVDPAPGLVFRDVRVGIALEEPREDDPRVPRAAHREGISYDRPLRLAEQAEDFPEVVDQPRQDEPPRMSIPAD